MMNLSIYMIIVFRLVTSLAWKATSVMIMCKGDFHSYMMISLQFSLIAL